MLAGFGAWLLGGLLKRSTADLLGKVFATLAGSPDGQAKIEEIRANADIALAREGTEQLRVTTAAALDRQRLKMNQPVFWVIISVMMGPPALILWGVAIYNILWWQHGIFPQPWAIADFPPSIKPWVEKSIDWLYDPVGAPSTVAAAGLASFLTRKR